MWRLLLSAAFFAVCAMPAAAQTPQPFPRAGVNPPPLPRQTPEPTAPAQPAAQQGAAAPADPNAPSTATVGFPIFPGAQYLASYEAGKGQRYYLYGSTASYGELVKWYQTQLRDRGDQIYSDPATHMFAQRFREEVMAFPPGVTIKNWTSAGLQGYPNPKRGSGPERFPVVIMIVPPLPEGGGR